MLRYLSFAFKNTLRNKRRSFLTISSVAVSLCLLGVLIAIYHALFMNQASPGQALRLVVRNRVSLAQPIPAFYEEKVRRVPGVKEVSVWNWYGGTYKDQDQKTFFARLGVEPKAFLTLRTQMEMPEDQRQAFIHDRQGAVVSDDLAQKLGFHIGQRIQLTGDIYPGTLDLKIVGIFHDPDAIQSMFFNWDYLKETLPKGRQNYISTIAVLADSTDDVPRIAKAVDDMFEDSPPQTKTESEQQFALSFVSFLGNIKLFLMAICAAVTFTILLVSGNTMAMSVRERIKEVGVLKTLGFTNQLILNIIIAEAITIALFGGVIGLALAFLLTFGLTRAGAGAMVGVANLTLTPFTIILSLLVALLIGFISSFVPAWNAARTNILDSLRYAG